MKRATGQQKEYVRILLAKLELPSDRNAVLTYSHRLAFTAVGVWNEQEFAMRLGMRVDAALDELDMAQCAALISILKSQL